MPHHFRVRLHSHFHSLKCCFMGVAHQIPAFCLGAAVFQRTTSAVADGRLIDSVALAQLLECQPVVCGALVLIGVRVVVEFGAVKVLLVATGGVDRPIGRHKSRDRRVFAGLELGTDWNNRHPP